MSDDPASKDGMRWEIRRSLIERLRIPWDAMGEMGNQQRAEAAVQISTMMDELEGWQAAMRKADRDIAQVRAERDAAIRERDEARRERDDARRWICRDCETPSISAQEIADSNNWDCFKVRSEP